MEKRTYAVSEHTKQALGNALKTLMKEKSLEKITIGELTQLCGMKRQNFYYHFEDIYDLLRWVFEKEAVVLLRRHEGAALWQDGLLQLFQYIQENREVCLCAIKSVGHQHIKQFFYQDIYSIVHRTIETIAASLDKERVSTAHTDVDLLTQFYVIALAGCVESWVLGELDRTPQQLITFADTMLQDLVRGATLRIQGGMLRTTVG